MARAGCGGDRLAVDHHKPAVLHVSEEPSQALPVVQPASKVDVGFQRDPDGGSRAPPPLAAEELPNRLRKGAVATPVWRIGNKAILRAVPAGLIFGHRHRSLSIITFDIAAFILAGKHYAEPDQRQGDRKANQWFGAC